jgi:hypothetical protein
VTSGRGPSSILRAGALAALLAASALSAPALAAPPVSVALPSDPDAVAGARGFAFAGARCGATADVETVAPDGSVSPVRDVLLSPGYSLAYAEPYLALTVRVAPPLELVRVFDLASGAQRDLPPAYVGRGSALALLADGTLVVGPGTHELVPAEVPQGLYVWPPGSASPALRTRAVAKGPVLAAGGRILFRPAHAIDGQAALGTVGLAGGPVAPVGAPGARGPRTPLAFDGTRAAFRSFSRRGAPQVTLVDLSPELRGPGVRRR